jgi:hypothetical protein
MHEAEDVEGHFLGGERANTITLEFMRDNVRRAHETSSAGPAIHKLKRERKTETIYCIPDDGAS